MHHRSTIRAAIAAALRAVPSFAGRVETNRMGPVEKGALPALVLQTLDEASQPGAQTETGRSLDRTVRFQVIATDFAGDDPDVRMDDLAALIEAAVQPLEVSPGIRNLVLASTRFDATQAETSAAQIIRVGLIFSVRYATEMGVPATAI
jgi:hypothetical protein